jgi:hypothetical protein
MDRSVDEHIRKYLEALCDDEAIQEAYKASCTSYGNISERGRRILAAMQEEFVAFGGVRRTRTFAEACEHVAATWRNRAAEGGVMR